MSTDRLWNRMKHVVGFARTTTAADESGNTSKVQIRVNDLQVIDGYQVVGQFGFQSSIPVGTDVVRMSVSGDLTNGVIVGTSHIESRMKGLPSGGSRHYDLGGRQVLLANDGLIQLFAPGEVLHKLVTEVFMQLFNSHTHGGVLPGGAQTAKPTQQMTAAHLTSATRAGT